MGSALTTLFLQCGMTPTFTYALIAGGTGVLIAFVVRP